MSTSRTYEVTLPDGAVATRTTESKRYTHAVIARGRNTYGHTESGFTVWRWSESRRAAEQYARSGGITTRAPRVVEVIEVTPELRAERRAAKAELAAERKADRRANAVLDANRAKNRAEAERGARGARGEVLARHGVELVDGTVVLAFAEFEVIKRSAADGYLVRCVEHDQVSLSALARKADAEKAGARKARREWCGGCEATGR